MTATKQYEIWIVKDTEIEVVAEATGRDPVQLRAFFIEKIAKDELCYITAYLTEEQAKDLVERKPVISQEEWARALDKRFNPDWP
jgi:hypothetical protein